MWPFKEKTAPIGPTRTGYLFQLREPFMFYDHARHPGVITNVFAVKKAALTEKEVSDFLIGQNEKRNEKYVDKIVAHLEAHTTEEEPAPWIRKQWDKTTAEHPNQGISLLQAYAEVLARWGYGVHVDKAYNEGGAFNKAILSAPSTGATLLHAALTKKKPTERIANRYVFDPAAIEAILGTPLAFTVILTGGVWRFDWQRGLIEVENRKST